MYTVHKPMLVGCAASRHIPAVCSWLTKSTKPAGMPRTTSQLKPSSGMSSANGRSGDSSRQTSRPSERVSSSATDSAMPMAVSSRAGAMLSCDSSAAICRELRRKQERASCFTSASVVLGACEHRSG